MCKHNISCALEKRLIMEVGKYALQPLKTSSILPQRLWFTKLGRVVTERLWPIKLHAHWWGGLTRSSEKWKTTTRLMHTKLNRVVFT